MLPPIFLVVGTVCGLTSVWILWTGLTQARIYLGRSSMKWLRQADDPRRFRVNLIAAALLLALSLLMIGGALV